MTDKYIEELETAFSVLKEEQSRFMGLERIYLMNPSLEKMMEADACKRKVAGIGTAINLVKKAMQQNYKGE